MNFTLSSTALTTRLVTLSRVINSKNSLPILGDFLFEVGDGQLMLTASDSENILRVGLPLTEASMGGRFAIGSKDLLEAMKGISEQPITFEVDENERKARIVYQNG